mmetsp:Transcript_32613/g.44777  ORF Transcript_32613/g.44777 Transcript_32613/m.44777 type:complete len:241 (-) Transcript_32613:237-959(-)
MHCFHASDTRAISHTSKVSFANLPQEFHLARLIERVEGSRADWSTEKPACTWYGVHCNAHSEIQQIDWSDASLTGPLQLRYLPESLEKFIVSGNKLCGQVSVSDLPPRLVFLRMDNNNFEGCVNFSALPEPLIRLSLDENMFTGKVCLTNLPKKLQKLYISDNHFSGELDLRQLPLEIEYVWLDNNKFTGFVDLSHLPPMLRILYLSDNEELFGEFSKADLPPRVRDGVFISKTKIRYTV